MFPRPPSPPLPPIFPSDADAVAAEASVDRHSYNPSILIIAAIVASAIVAAASIHLLLRVLSRSRSPPVVHHLDSSSSLSSSPSISESSPPSDQDPKAVIDSLPLFSLSCSTAAKSPSSLDCAVCLSPFQPSDELRLLPSCRHAFHSQCIDTWLKTSLSCPLCRAPIRPISNPPPPTPPAAESTRSESFRVEIGSVSRRTDESSTAAPHDPPVRSFSLGSSFEYVVEEEIEAVLSRVRRRTAAEKSDLGSAVVQPGDSVAEIAGVSHRSWLKEYVDRLTSSASSSFSSLRFSQRVSHGGGSGVSEGWDLERNLHLHLEEEDGGFSAFYRWLVGA